MFSGLEIYSGYFHKSVRNSVTAAPEDINIMLIVLSPSPKSKSRLEVNNRELESTVFD